MAKLGLKQLDSVLTGSLQVSGSAGVTGSIEVSGNISGSSTSTGSFGRVEATDIVAQTYTVSSSVTNISIATLSGSTQFGDTLDDTHQFTGSLLLDGDMTSTSTGSFGFIEVGGEPVVANVIIDGGSF